MSTTAQSINPSNKLLSKYQNTKSLLVLRVLILLLVASFLLIPLSPFYVEQSATAKVSSNADWQANWINARGLGYEQKFYFTVSSLLTSAGKATGFAATLLECLFYFILSARVCLLFVIIGIFYAVARKKFRYDKDDILSLTGNKRGFFSGVRLNLNDSFQENNPELHVPSLVCLDEVNPAQVKSHDLAKFLERHQALNETNSHLLAIILKHADYPAFIGDEARLDNYNILEHCDLVLKGILDRSTTSNVDLQSLPENLSKEQIVSLYKLAINLCLSDKQKTSFEQLPNAVLTTLILASEAGKVLCYEKNASDWACNSLFPELSARAVLHSLKSFRKDYNYLQRTLLRRALIYSKRHSDFGPTRLPLKLSTGTLVLRQLAEILQYHPEELVKHINDIEFFGKLNELKESFLSNLFVWSHENQTKLKLAVEDERLFLSIKDFLSIFAKSASTSTLDYIIKLNPEKQSIAAEQSDSLEKEHELNSKEIKLWVSVYKLFVDFGWFAKRIGQYRIKDFALLHIETEGGVESGQVAFRAKGLLESHAGSGELAYTNIELQKFGEEKQEVVANG